jgi:hypothetical protein
MNTLFRVASALALIVVITTTGISAAVWDQLPAWVAAERPNQPFTLRMWDWLGQPLLVGAPALVLVPLALLLPRWPNATNVPGAEAWRTLPLDVRQRTFAPVRAWLGLLTCTLALLAPALQWARYQELLGHSSVVPHLVAPVITVVPLLIGFTLFFPRFEEDVKREHQKLPPASPKK